MASPTQSSRRLLTGTVAGAIALIAFCAIGPTKSAHAAPTVSVRLEPKEVRVGEDARLIFEVKGASSIPEPKIAPVPGLRIRSLGQTMSMEFVNGAMSTEVTQSFLVRPERVGQFEIPSTSIRVGDTTLSTKPLRLVARESAGLAGKSGREPNRRERKAPTEAQADHGAFLEIKGLPQRPLFVGELLPVEILLYVRDEMRVSQVSPPSILENGFTLQRPPQQQPAQQRIRLGGGVYTRLTFPAALSPVKPGELNLAAELELTAQVVRRADSRRGRSRVDPFFDRFFGSFGQRAVEEQVPVQSSPVQIEVAALPPKNRPRSFSGAIGHFEVSSKATPTQVGVGDPITWTIDISGQGNFDRLKLPELQSDEDWKTYQPTSTFEPDDTLGYSGTKTFEQAILPLQSNLETLPQREFSYFDPESRLYVSQPISGPTLEIEAATSNASANPFGSRISGRRRGYQLAPNEMDIGTQWRDLAPAATHPWFLALQGLPIAFLVGAFWWGGRRRRLALDPTHQRKKQVQRELEDLLQKMDAAVQARDAVGFFETARRALQQRVAGIEGQVAPESLTPPEIEKRLARHPKLRERAHALFAAGDALTYGASNETGHRLEEFRSEVSQLLDALELESGT